MTAITLMDGAIGQELVRRHGTPPTPLWSTAVMMEDPGLVRAVHDAYFAAGATIASTNTYAVHENRLARAGLEGRQGGLIAAGCTMAAAARDAHGVGRVAGAFGPLLASYRPDLEPDPALAAPKFAAMAEMMGAAVDLYLIETVCSLREAAGALAGLCGRGRPVWIAFSVMDTDGARLRSGEALEGVLPLLDGFDVGAVLLNCSVPEAMAAGLAVLSRQPRPFGAYANGFTGIAEAFLADAPTVDTLQARADLTPAAYADFALGWVDQGATILGGCCEVGPKHIAELARRLQGAGHDIV